jgi:hypothetical protein
MKFAAITLLLCMARASALGIKPSKTRAMADAARRLQGSIATLKASFETSVKARRLQGLDMEAMMKPECQEACPGVKDMLMSFMELATQSTTSPAPGTEGDAMMKMLQEMLCPHMDTLSCMQTNADSACKSAGGGERRLDAHEGGGMDMMSMVGCLCVCPDLAAISSGRRLDAHEGSLAAIAGSRRLDAHEGSDGDGDASMQAMCANPTGTIVCMTSKTECDSMEKMMMASMEGNFMGYLGVACDWASNKCEGKMESCDGGDAASQEFDSKGCGKPETTDKSPCCDSVAKMKECQGETCMKLSFVMLSMAGDEAKGQYEEILKVSKACPEVGMPKSKDEVSAVLAASENKMSGGTTEDASGGDAASGAFHTIPALGMVTVLALAP